MLKQMHRYIVDPKRVWAPKGQFSKEPEVSISDIHDGADPEKKEATMEVKGNKLHVTR